MVPEWATNVIGIASGPRHTLALMENGIVAAWGSNQYGPIWPPSDLTRVVRIAAGEHHSLALVEGDSPAQKVSLANPRPETGGFSVVVPTQPGRVYALEYKTSLSEEHWTALPLAVGKGGYQWFTDPATSSAQRFYRVRRW